MEKFKVDFSPSNVLKLCAKNNIKVVDIKRLEANMCLITINKSDSKIFKKCFNIKKVKINYFAIMLTIFSIIFCSCLFFISNFIVKIKIDVDNEALKKEVYSVVQEYVKPLCNKKDIDLLPIKTKLLENKDIALCDVKIVGLVLYVSIKENEAIPESEFKPIIASVDGVVESVNLVSGTALVEKGNFVKKGDILIAPEIVVDDKIIPTRALGEVNLLAYKQKKHIFLENQIEYRQTGEYSLQKYFTIFNNFVKINKCNENYSTYEKIVTTKKTKIGFIPIELNYVYFYETKAFKTQVNFDEVKDIEMAKVLETLKNETLSEAIYSENVQYKKLGEGIYQIIATVQYPILIV